MPRTIGLAERRARLARRHRLLRSCAPTTSPPSRTASSRCTPQTRSRSTSRRCCAWSGRPSRLFFGNLNRNRKNNHFNTDRFNAAGLYKRSIVWQYFGKGIKRFSDLNFKLSAYFINS